MGRLDIRDCTHHHTALSHLWYKPDPSGARSSGGGYPKMVHAYGVQCSDCGLVFEEWLKADAQRFCVWRGEWFEHKTGLPKNGFYDMLEQPLSVGDRVVYPAGGSGRAVQLVVAVIEGIENPTPSFDPNNQWGARARNRHGAPLRLTVKTQRLGSRWNRYSDGSKATTLQANAVSAVRV